MPNFLRDQLVTNISISEDGLRQLGALFEERAEVLRKLKHAAGGEEDPVFVTYVIRFDEKGYRFFSVDDAVSRVSSAIYVERVVFRLETGSSMRSNEVIGEVMEVRLDSKDTVQSYFKIMSDNGEWVEASFAALQCLFKKFRNGNGLVRNAWTLLFIQLLDVVVGFVLSLYAATNIAPRLAVVNSFEFSFIFMLLMFSNVWTYLNGLILRLVNWTFPNIRFVRKDRERFHWAVRVLLEAALGGFVLYMFAQMGSFVIQAINALIVPG